MVILRPSSANTLSPYGFGRLPRLLCSWKSDDKEEREEEEEDATAVCPTAADLESSELGSNARNPVGFIDFYAIRHPFHLAAHAL